MAEEEKVEIRPDIARYVEGRTAEGKRTLHTGDLISQRLSGATLDEIYIIAGKIVPSETSKSLKEKYEHLNNGQQSMTVRNLIRGAVAAINRKEDGETAGDEQFTEATEKLVARVAERFEKLEKAKADAAAKREKEAAAKAEAKAKAKAKKAEKKAA